ncbi:hypothetical protein FCK90_00760 [Kocuria coralli]|uniref:Uncharacterized protein n=1 Tax=Kocuria coralli TaxID=1461025 RepID=A0A5J5L141_9MICC|nr:hypothetical protein [Kocuria coralli]KAA9395592.1 hypothetical protein FCK90_00760 [Kocuria coralli]
MPSTTRPARSDGDAASAPVRPQAIVPLVLIVGAQALILGAGAAYMVFSLATGQVWSVPGAIFLIVVFGSGCLWLAGAARGLWRGKRWPRAAAFTVQLFSLVAAGAIVYPMSAIGAVVLIVAAVTAMVCLFLRPVVDWTTQELRPELR